MELSPGKILDELSSDEAAQYEKLWLKAFAGGRKRAGKLKTYLWHVFSYEEYPYLALEKAEKAYEKQIAPEYIVLCNDSGEAIVTDKLPTKVGYFEYFVFPKNLAWTYAVTHEDGWLGPYFAKHKDYDLLNEKNKKKIAKLKEIEEAKRKGWM